MGVRGENLALVAAFLHQDVNGVRDEIFLLQLVDVLLKEAAEHLFAELEVVGGEAPHVHGAEGLAVELDVGLSVDGVVAIDLAVSLFPDVQVLGHAREVEILVVVADTTGDLAIFGESVVKLEADDAACAGCAFVGP